MFRWGWEIEFGNDVALRLIDDVVIPREFAGKLPPQVVDDYVLEEKAFMGLPLDVRIKLTEGLAKSGLELRLHRELHQDQRLLPGALNELGRQEAMGNTPGSMGNPQVDS